MQTPLSLRERKRLQTRADIEEHATRLVAERGYAAVTVDDICEAAGISKRTFFNYVDSKETAVLGEPPRDFNEEQRGRFLSPQHANVVAALLDLTLDNVISGQFADPEQRAVLLRRRKRIRRSDPDLDHLGSSRLNGSYAVLTEMLQAYYQAFPEAKLAPELTDAEESAQLALVVIGAIRLGFSSWVDAKTESYEQLRPRCKASLHSITRLCRALPDKEENDD